MGYNKDYRVSTIIVLCKDCNEDVGLYPARHKCTNNKRPVLPILYSSTSVPLQDIDDMPELVPSLSKPISVTRQASDSSIESGKWNLFRSNSNSTMHKADQTDEEESPSVYFDSYANLKVSNSYSDLKSFSGTNSSTNSTSAGKKLWGKMKENEKWKELVAEKKKESKTSAKLWERIIQGSLAKEEEQYHSAGAESDEDDWERETHVSRILREYHLSKYKEIPSWLYDDRKQALFTSKLPTEQTNTKSVTNRRLWETDTDEKPYSPRQREIQALREGNTMHRSQSERFLSKPTQSQKEHYNTKKEIYGSIAPRRTFTTRRLTTNTSIA